MWSPAELPRPLSEPLKTSTNPARRRRKKSRKQPPRIEKREAEDNRPERGSGVEAVGSSGFEKELSKKLTDQRQEISEGQDNAVYALEGMQGLKGRKPIPIHITFRPTEWDAGSTPQPLRATIQNVYMMLSIRALTRAADSNRKAIEELRQGHIGESLDHYLRAEQSVGKALAFGTIEKVSSWIAKAKAKSRHRETNAVRAEAIMLYDAEIEQNVSAEEAADELLGRIQWPNGKAVGHRTLVEWISAEKKKRAFGK